MEAALVAVLKARCPRVYPDAAPVGTARPYVTYQAFGGMPMRYLDNTAADKRHAFVQIDVWADTRLQASQIVRGIEDDLCAATSLTARPDGEPRTEAVDLQGIGTLYGASQDFSIWSTR